MNESAVEAFKWFVAIGMGAAATALLPWFKAWLSARKSELSITDQIRKEGFEAVVTRLDARVKELTQEIEADEAHREIERKEWVERLDKLRDMETECRVQQARMMVKLESAEAKITALTAEVNTLKRDSKSIPLAPLIAIQATGDVTMPKETEDDKDDSAIERIANLTPEQIEKSKERIGRKKP